MQNVRFFPVLHTQSFSTLTHIYVLFDLYLLLSALYPDSHSIHCCVLLNVWFLLQLFLRLVVIVVVVSLFWVGQTFAHFFPSFSYFFFSTVLLSIFYIAVAVCVCVCVYAYAVFFFCPSYVRLLLQDAQFSLPLCTTSK